MMELWGNPQCESCETAKNMLLMTPIEFTYIIVGKEFQGTIPLLKLDDGRQITGLPAIKQYAKNILRSMGLPQDMIP